MKKKIFPTELAYVLGLFILSVGVALMERADFGVSMVVAPAYLLHLKISEFLPFFSFGMAEYTLQALLLLALCVLFRRGKRAYLCSFGTAFLYGWMLDGVMALLALVPGDGMVARLFCYFAGMLCCAVGVALLFRTYIAPEAYELFVKEIAARYRWNVHRCKTVYDCVSCLASVVISFLFFGWGHFVGVKLGTVFCALCNGTLIGLCGKWLESHFTFADRLPFRRFFEE